MKMKRELKKAGPKVVDKPYIEKRQRAKVRYLVKADALHEADKRYIGKRIREITDLFHPLSFFEVEVSRDKRGFYRVEVNVKEPHMLHRAEKISKSVQGSIDMVIDKLRTHIVKVKDKRRELRERGARSIKKKTVLDDAARF